MSEPSRPEDETEPRKLSDHLKLYLSEPTLWPVALVVVLVFVTLGATALVAALQRNLLALAALALLVGMSADQVLRELRGGGAGWVTGLVGGFWLLSVLVAVAALQSGLF